MKNIYIFLYFFSVFIVAENYEPFESTYEPLPPTNTIFRNANIYDGEGNELNNTDLIIKDGKVVARFEPRTKPDAPEVLKAIEAALAK